MDNFNHRPSSGSSRGQGGSGNDPGPGTSNQNRLGQSRGRGDGGNGRRGNYVPPNMRNGRPGQEGGDHNVNGVQGGNNCPRRQYDGPRIGFKRLYECLQKPPDEVLVFIHRNLAEWVALLKSDTLATPRSDDLLVLIIQVIAEKISSSEDVLSKQIQIEVLSHSLGDEFIGRIVDKCNDISLLGDDGIRRPNPNNPMPVDQSPLKIVKDLFTFYSFIYKKIPSTACDCLRKLIQPTISCFEALNKTNPEVDALHLEFLGLRNKYTELLKRKQSSNVQTRPYNSRKEGFTPEEEEALHRAVPEEDFRTISVIPTIEELLSPSQVWLKPNKKTGAYDDAQHYLDVQFRLLREDFVRPLKTGIGDYLKNRNDYLDKKGKKKMPQGNVRIYQDVEVAGVNLVKEILVYNMRLPASIYKKVKWDRSKRLLHGSLLVFTSDLFQSASFATVKERDVKQLTEKGILGVVWEGQTPDLKANKLFLMVECEVYFEAFRYNLERLKEIELERFPMNRFVVYASSIVNPPTYLVEAVEDDNIILRLGKSDVGFDLDDPLELATWPSGAELGLDEAQFLAFQAAITKEFAIIQGPPGTGKTFLGLKMAEVFLSNEQIYFPEDSFTPILVVCYTNHALDQFLEGILDYMERNPYITRYRGEMELKDFERPQIVRVGSRSKSEKLGLYSLETLRRSSKSLTSTFFNARRSAMNNLDEYQWKRSVLLGAYKFFENYSGLVDFQKLKIWELLKPELPEKLWDLLASVDWYGLSSDLFKKRNFSAENTFKNWFKGCIREAPIDSIQSLLNQMNLGKENGPKPQEMEVDQDEEDFNLEELERDRFIDAENEDAIMEFLKKGRKVISDNQFLPPCIGVYCLITLRRTITEKQIQIQQVFNDKLLTEDVKFNVMGNIEEDVNELDKKSQLLTLILEGLKDKKIEIPSEVEIRNIIEKVETGTLRSGFTHLAKNEKFGLYLHAVEKAKVILLDEISKVNERIAAGHRQLEQAYEIADAEILRESRVVGMTTTGAAKYSNLVGIMKSKIVIVEEAAEVLESHIVTCLTRHCQHLILIGDHQQLKPSTTVYELSKKYNLDISLFERMLNNNLSCYKLKTQHRMRPEIANLVVGTIYPELLNHPSVNNYPVVKGLTKNLFFISHTELEKSEADSMSKSNVHEARFMAHLSRHFVLQGYDPTQITVLTTYTGQMFLIKKEMRGFEDTRGVRVTVVDNFQGEENDIILLSLVRSNEEKQKNSDVIGKIGFLKEDNRICVALSRAKHGLFVIGNMDSLSANSATWTQIKEKLMEREEIGEKLTLRCVNHRTITLVRDWEDFSRVPEGGCTLPCEAKLKCRHQCQSVCHIKDSEHLLYKCEFRCEKICPNLHQCQSRCFQCSVACAPCTIRMDKTLGCGHIKRMPCHEPEEGVECNTIVEKTLPCGHKEKMACFVKAAEYPCRVRMLKSLRCGIPEHMREMECFKNPDDVDCKAIVEKTLLCGHTQGAQCFRDPEVIDCHNKIDKILECGHTQRIECKDKAKKELPCREKCTTRLECGHACPQLCHIFQDPAHENVDCNKECSRICAEGLHKCTGAHKCLLPCPPCPVQVEKGLPCGHSKSIKCHVDPGTVECLSPCEMVLPCTHKCQGLCFQKPCGDCKEIVKKYSGECGHYQQIECSKRASKASCEVMVQLGSKGSCGHDVMVPCRIQFTVTPDDATNFCTAPCIKFKRFDENLGGCDHQCKGDCTKCLQGRIHLKCKEDCGRQLICGHTCGYPCSATCPPCIKECIQGCEHSKCAKPCGEPCQGCAEPCGWKCPHKVCTALCREPCNRGPCDEPCPEIIEKCGHPCVGFCGEPCPPLCRECDKEELTTLFLGFEEEENARFVHLVDCGHTIESIGLEMHLRITDGNGEEGGNELNAVKAKVCPYCSTVIRTNRRFGDLIKAQYTDVNTVKNKIWGNTKAFKAKQEKIFTEIKQDYLWTKYFPTFRLNFLNKLARSEGKKGQRIRFNQMNSWTIESLEIIAGHVKDSAKILNKSDSGLTDRMEGDKEKDMARLRHLRMEHLYNFGNKRADNPKLSVELFNDLKDRYNQLILGLWERIPLNPTEISDFSREFERLFDLGQIYLRKSSPTFPNNHVVGKRVYDELMRSILAPFIYTEERKRLIIEKLKELDEAIKSGLGISESEKREIVRAMGFRKGHWFKCRNGHVYAIDACGGAMQEANCPECGARIGGGNHHLLPDNDLAPEMDGADRQAWPGGLH